MMRYAYEQWAIRQLDAQVRCRVEPGMSCIPLRGDPICRACFYSDHQEQLLLEAAAGDPATDEAQAREVAAAGV